MVISYVIAAQLLTAAAFLSIFYSPKLPSYVSADFSCAGSQVVFSNPSDLTIRSTFLEIIQTKNDVTQCQVILLCFILGGVINSVKFQFLCSMSNESLEVLCIDWHHCTNPVNFTALVPLNQTTLYGGLANFVVAQIKIGNSEFTPECTSGSVASTCTLDCDDQDVNLLLKDNRVSTEEAYTTYQFWVFLALMIVGWVGQAVNVSIADAICFELLGKCFFFYSDCVTEIMVKAIGLIVTGIKDAGALWDGVFLRCCPGCWWTWPASENLTWTTQFVFTCRRLFLFWILAFPQRSR